MSKDSLTPQFYQWILSYYQTHRSRNYSNISTSVFYML
jgi:hypothetical protein